MTVDKRPASSREARLKQLWLDQKHTLDVFLEHGAISKAQYEKSLGDFTKKMGINIAYNELHDAKEAGLIPVIWRRGVYPSRETARKALARGDLYVLEESGRIIGSAVINQVQDEVYAGAPWQFDEPDERVCVLHTLMISPSEFGKGHARSFLDFYEAWAREHGCPELRIGEEHYNLIRG